MTTVLTQAPPKRKRIPGGIAIFIARIVLFWEKLWPALMPALALPFLYAIFSLADLWRLMPGWLHGGLLILGALGFAALLVRDLRKLRFPTRSAGQARLEADGNVRHAALRALDDSPFNQPGEASPLWRAHQAEMLEQARKARLRLHEDIAAERDPYGLRFIALGLLAIAFVAGGKDSAARLALGLNPGAHQAGGALIADLWIEPPAYAGRAPIYLMRAGERIGEASGIASGKTQINAPQGSILSAQINGLGKARLSYQTTTETLRREFERDGGAARAQLPLGQSGVLNLRLRGKEIRWAIGVIGDDAPTVAFTEPPARTDDARIEFAFATQDDYGIDTAQLILRLDPDQERPLDSPPLGAAALEEVRAITLDGGGGAAGERRVTLDLQADPWAGLNVLAHILVRDGAGQQGKTKTVSTTLPARTFFNPVAKAVIEQRQTLAVAADEWRRPARSFDAMTLAPEIFYAEKPTDYLLLRAAFWRVMRRNGDDYNDAVEKFWPLALQLEDEALELARQRLEAAQEALRQALEHGADDAEIERLVEELRQAMNDYLTALAQSGQQADGQTPNNAQRLEQSDLDDMLDAIRDLSEQGAGAAARQMLSDLENMLNNLRLSQSGSGQGQGSGKGASGEASGGAAGQAGEMIGRQRELADEAFERGQASDGNGDDLAAREGGLGGDLDEMIDQLSNAPEADPNGEAARALGRARNAMRDAESALRGDDFAAASDAMERAISGLREGAQTLAREQMRQAQGDGQGEAGARGPATDPLGRPAGEASGQGVDVPGMSEAGRTRAVIDELRRRLGQPGREDDEVDYLERLLERF